MMQRNTAWLGIALKSSRPLAKASLRSATPILRTIETGELVVTPAIAVLLIMTYLPKASMHFELSCILSVHPKIETVPSHLGRMRWHSTMRGDLVPYRQ